MSQPKEPQYDPIVEEQIEHALAPYVGLLPPEALADMREMLGDYLTTHPVAQRLVRQLQPPPQVERSGDVVRDSLPEDAVEGTVSRKAGGGAR